MIDSINRIELNPEQMESFSGGHALGIYRPWEMKCMKRP